MMYLPVGSLGGIPTGITNKYVGHETHSDLGQISYKLRRNWRMRENLDNSQIYRVEPFDCCTCTERHTSRNTVNSFNMENDSLPVPADQPAITLLERQFLAGFLCLIAVLGVIGNTVVILSVCLSYKLRTKMNMFVVNLSFADFLTSLHLVWIMVAFVSEDGWPLPDGLCVWCGFVLITCIGASVYTLACIAINRLVLIRYGQTAYGILYKPVVIVCTFSAIWLVPLSMASIPLVFDFGELGYSTRYRTCIKNHAHQFAREYDVLLSLTYYPIPTAVIIISYVRVFLYLRSRVRKLAPAAGDATILSVVHVTENQRDGQPNLRQQLDKRQVQVTKNMFYIVCLFFLCTTPYGLTLLCSQPICFRLTSYSAVVLSLNSCINPFIYATKHPDFKRVIRCILLCQMKKIPQRVNICGDINA